MRTRFDMLAVGTKFVDLRNGWTFEKQPDVDGEGRAVCISGRDLSPCMIGRLTAFEQTVYVSYANSEEETKMDMVQTRGLLRSLMSCLTRYQREEKSDENPSSPQCSPVLCLGTVSSSRNAGIRFASKLTERDTVDILDAVAWAKKQAKLNAKEFDRPSAADTFLAAGLKHVIAGILGITQDELDTITDTLNQ